MRKFKAQNRKQMHKNSICNSIIVFLSLLILFSFLIKKINLDDEKVKTIISSYLNVTFKEKNEVMAVSNKTDNDLPIVYLYNTHNRENYVNLSFNLNFNISYTKLMLSDYLNELGIKTVISKFEGNNYAESRKVLEKDYANNPSLTYFIDLHRDAGTHNFTTVTVKGKDYAKILFVLGLENESYMENKKIMERLNNELKDISRGILEKSGPTVNGIYNQDFNKNTFLIEIGGEENNIEEVSNTLKKVASSLHKIIKEDQNGKKEI